MENVTAGKIDIIVNLSNSVSAPVVIAYETEDGSRSFLVLTLPV